MSKINIVTRLQRWMDSVPGQTFLNYAYSWGASVIILGALFKLTHLKGANFMLFIGMGTEVVVFFLSAFDRPFDKNEQGKELPEDFGTDEEIGLRPSPVDESLSAVPLAGGSVPVTVVGGGVPLSAVSTVPSAVSGAETPVPSHAPLTLGGCVTPEGDVDAARLAEIIRLANDELLNRAQAVLSPEMEEASRQYIEKLRVLGDTLARVDEQNARLTRDSEEMENLNRTLTGINKVYELHLKSISLQVGTIDQINEQTARLARQIEELNQVYARMISAMTVAQKPAS